MFYERKILYKKICKENFHGKKSENNKNLQIFLQFYQTNFTPLKATLITQLVSPSYVPSSHALSTFPPTHLFLSFFKFVSFFSFTRKKEENSFSSRNTRHSKWAWGEKPARAQVFVCVFYVSSEERPENVKREKFHMWIMNEGRQKKDINIRYDDECTCET
jgi:hypothetical protein